MEQINLHLENFEGPFDLLLKLIKVNKMEITDIKIFEITEQYMTVLRAMDELDLDIASEFFVLAATLIEIKSRELLPKKSTEEAEIPTKEMLLHKLREYEFFRNKSYDLMSRFCQDEVIVTRLPMTLPEEKHVEIIIPEGFGPDKFFLLYMELLDGQREKQNVYTNIERRISIESFKIEDIIKDLMERIELAKTVRFSALAQQSSGKAETIVIFLAILEMVRNLQVMVYQDEAGGELIIEERGTEHGTEQETGSRPDDGSTIYLGPNE
ncbi:MAG: segregation/condensation protein A [Clostridiaceae bacterium]